jgi:two-component sensor histidine kinase
LEAIQGVITRRLTRLVGDIRPYSFRAFAVAVICFLGAVGLHIALRWLGGSFAFVTYFPALLLAALVGGFPSGLLVAILSFVTVWWALTAPAFQFFPLSRVDQIDFIGFLLASGTILLVTGLYRASLSQLRQNEQERELVMEELEHRARNTYAVIDVIVQQTLEDEPERADLLSGRICALKFTDELLNKTTTHRMLLQSLLLHEFVPYGEGRFRVDGPDVELSPDTARHLALVFHELVTNAVKHGALSRPEGQVLISWRHMDGVIRLEWREEGGPVPNLPKRYGFGSRIIERSVKSVSGLVASTFARDGLRCAITFKIK